MPDQHTLYIQLTPNDNQLKLSLDHQYTHTTSWLTFTFKDFTLQYLMLHANDYGRALFEQTVGQSDLRTHLLALPPKTRLVLHIDDPAVAAIPWEYLRAPDYLLAAHLALVRYIPATHPQSIPDLSQDLTILAIPVAPIDDQIGINTEGEWHRLETIVRDHQKSVSLVRVRPPTLSALEENLLVARPCLVHFMGHGIVTSDGKTALIFEDHLATAQAVSPLTFADGLDENVFLVLLNSCLSASDNTTEFGNIARFIVRQGVPYAIGMSFKLPDVVAQHLTGTFYMHLLRGCSIEESIRRVRQFFELDTSSTLHKWAAGLPVLYTSLLDPLPALKLPFGTPTIVPDPIHLQSACNLAALARSNTFIGRVSELRAALDLLLTPGAYGFVLLHGLGGIGKTAVAGALARRASWYYNDRVLAYSFETFATFDHNGTPTISTTFADKFYSCLASFYGLDPKNYPTTLTLQQAIIHYREHHLSMLVLDNLDTLVDTQKKGNTFAQSLASFICALATGQGVILLTSRSIPPSDWGQLHTISLEGLSNDDGASLFLSTLSGQRQATSPFEDCQALSRQVQGHPLSIRLLANRFDESISSLATFSQSIEAELTHAEQATPSSLQDPNRHKTLYACLAYSINRLNPAQKRVLQACGLFLAPFPPEFAANLFVDEIDEQATEEQQAEQSQHQQEQSELTLITLQQLQRLGLLDSSAKTYPEGTLQLLDLHAMTRWYLHTYLSSIEPIWQQRYALTYLQLDYDKYDSNSLIRTLIRQSLPDCEASLAYLPHAQKSLLAYHIAEFYQRLGQLRHAQELYAQSLKIYQELGDVRSIAVTQHAMAAVLVQQGKPAEAMKLYEESLQTKQQLGDVREIAVTQANMSQVLFSSLNEPQQAIALAWEAYQSLDSHGYIADAQTMQSILADMKSTNPTSFDTLWSQQFQQPQPDWLLNVQPAEEDLDEEQLEELAQTIIGFINTSNWPEAQQFVESHQSILFQPQVEDVFNLFIQQARENNDEDTVDLLETHLAILQSCAQHGIPETFAPIIASQQNQQPSPNDE